MAFKSQHNMSRDTFDSLLTVIGSLPPDDHVLPKYCPKCKSSRFMEVDSGDGQKRQLDIPLTILRHLPFIPRIQRLYMTEESAKQMTWHKIENDTILTRWCMHPMVKHENTLMPFTVRKPKRLVMYVLRWPHMGSIPMERALPRTHVGPCLLSQSISP